jgi:site-specific DNA-methyltransferase (adenine-specific)
MTVAARILVGDNRQTLKTLEDQSVQCVVTSPPYWGLRDYGTATWVGGDPECSHRRESKKSDKTITGHKNFTEMLGVGDAIYKDSCPRCGAVREDEQIGLELTPDEYIEQLCQVFDEVWRVLRDDGTIWVNLGDTYAMASVRGKDSSFGGGVGSHKGYEQGSMPLGGRTIPDGIKAKDLIGIPWRFAFAMQARGWYLRQDIIWAKPNPMPESVTDRCTKSHEYIFLLTKQPRYFFDHEAIKEEGVTPAGTKGAKGSVERAAQAGVSARPPEYKIYDGMRNKRDVWTVATKPYKEAHFATYPTALITPCIMAGSKEGDTILDPFSGSGTTGEVALMNGRNYIGTELNPEYAQLSEKRISTALGMLGDVTVEHR